jgi:D-alanyl-D-alanine carboxypeptidase (penicillin-binding protein 5/6)
MRRGLAATVVAAALAVPPVTLPAALAAPAGAPPALGPPQAKAWMVVDADTGAVVAASGDHVPLRPASVVKIVTALVAAEALPSFATVPVGPDAAGEEAAKINMQAGQVWPLNDALHSLLIVSANDAAEALADRVSGSPGAFGRLEEKVLAGLGAVDQPILQDPAGLDDSFANNGGDFISAYDLAIATRAAMTIPEIREIVAEQVYPFVGPDGTHHVLRNHNKLLLNDATVVGVKDGYTQQAGDTYIGEAVRGGRSMIVVEMGITNPNMYDAAEYLFSIGFATPVSAEPSADRLPAVHIPNVAALAASGSAAGASGSADRSSGAGGSGAGTAASPGSAAGRNTVATTARTHGGSGSGWLLGVVAAGLVGVVVQRRRISVRRRRRRGSALRQETQRGVDGPELLWRGEVVDAWERDEASVR